MTESQVVKTESGEQFAREHGLSFFETSAKEDVNVKEVFERLVDIICEKMAETLDSDPTRIGGSKPGVTKLKEKSPNDESSGCGC